MSPSKELVVCVSISLLFAIFHFGICSTSRNADERKNVKNIFDLLLNIGTGVESPYGGEKLVGRLECPLCDSSVYSYCSEKLLHDACCCLNPYEHKLPYQCKFADCGFLHANSCREHKLITACCCTKVHSRQNGKIPITE